MLSSEIDIADKTDIAAGISIIKIAWGRSSCDFSLDASESRDETSFEGEEEGAYSRMWPNPNPPKEAADTALSRVKLK